jgi:hypothetical protein
MNEIVERERQKQRDRQTDRRTDGQTDRRTDGRTDGQTDRVKEKYSTLCSSRAAMNVFGSNPGSVTIFPPQCSVGRQTTFSPKM